MSKWAKTKEQIVLGDSDANIGFDEICNMLRNLGFKERISKSSHHIFTMPNVREIINLQPDGNGKAKKYQVRQVRFLIRFMASDNKYSIEMMWSDADGAYLSQVRELPGCCADGLTPEEAFQNIRIVMQEWLETAAEEGREIPAPITFDVLARNAQAAHTVLQQQIENRVREVVGQILEQMERQQAQPNIPSWREHGLISFTEPKFAKSH